MKTDDIELLLTQHFQQQSEYLDDDGFTANVMSAIPQKKNLNPWVKRTIFWLPILLVSMFVLSQLPLQEIIHSVAAFFITASAKQFLFIAGAGFAMIMTYVGFTFMSDAEA